VTANTTPAGPMSGYRVTPGDLSAAGSYVATQAADIEAKISALRTYVLSLSNYWGGPAHGQFENLMTDYNIYAAMLHNALTEIAAGLHSNSQNYSVTEDTNVGNIIKINLPPPNFGS
jgi:WXG100 family type VII secretion target